MEIVTRQEAIERGLGKYFTGEPCKNGHIAERYVQSSTCQLCISGHNPNSEEQRASRQRIAETKLEMERERLKLAQERSRLNAQIAQQKLDLAAERARINARRVALSEERKGGRSVKTRIKSQLTKIQVSVIHEDIHHLRNWAWILAADRDPSVTFMDVACPNLIPGALVPTAGRYTLACFPEDRADVEQYAIQLFNSHCSAMMEEQIIRKREERNKQLLAEEDAAARARMPEWKP